jgi:HAD superfamily hydrolase (TIGR01490 family)
MILAIFDVDFTLIKNDSLLLFGFFIFKKKGLRIARVPSFAFSLLHGLLGDSDGTDLKVHYLKMICGGMKSAEIDYIAKEFTEKILVKAVSKAALDRIKWHKDLGHQIVLCSASLDIYLLELARILSVHNLICTQLFCENGIVTGELRGKNCKGREKLSRLQSEYDGRGIDWEQSYAYSDSKSDMPILELVGNPIVVNPNSRMRRIALRNQWQIENWK